MFMHMPTAPGAAQVPLSRIAREIDPRANAMLSTLCHVLQVPTDAPRFAQVIATCDMAVRCFRSSLINPTDELVNLEDDLSHLVSELARVMRFLLFNQGLEVPLYRRLSRYQAWGLFIALSSSEAPENISQAVGAELAISMITRRRFSTGFAGIVRRSIDPAHPLKGGDRNLIQEKFQRSVKSIFGRAKRIFTVFGEAEWAEQSADKDLLEQHLNRRRLLGTVRHKQGILTWRDQSVSQLLLSAVTLREKAEGGDHDALVSIVAFLAGVPIELALTIRVTSDLLSSTIRIDLDNGTIETYLHRIYPDAARPSLEAASAFHDSQQVIVKPMPGFVSSLLQETRKQRPQASMLGELLFVSNTSGREPVYYEEGGLHQPSIKRFLEAAAPFLVTMGINRTIAAALTNDFHIVPIAKFYYTTISREEIWAASKIVFDILKWGKPTALLDGPAVGSQVTPTPAAVAEWYQWMQRDLHSLPQGRNMNMSTLIEFHNCYARLVGSLIVFDFAARVAKELKFLANMFEPGSRYLSFSDKKAGSNMGPHPVPISNFSAEQIRLWRLHCAALYERINKQGNALNHLQKYIADILAGHNVPILFLIEGERAIPVGSTELTNWWPPQLRFPGNFGRHFWQHELKKSGIQDSYIDAFVRHESSGVELFTSTSASAPKDWMDAVARARDSVLANMGIIAVRGLSGRSV